MTDLEFELLTIDQIFYILDNVKKEETKKIKKQRKYSRDEMQFMQFEVENQERFEKLEFSIHKK